MTFAGFDPAAALLVAALITRLQEPAVAHAVTKPDAVERITPRDVALRLYEQGFVAATLPHDEPGLAQTIVRAYEGSGTRLGDLPGRRVDLIEIRQQLELITREAERYGRSVECERYRPAFVTPVGRS